MPGALEGQGLQKEGPYKGKLGSGDLDSELYLPLNIVDLEQIFSGQCHGRKPEDNFSHQIFIAVFKTGLKESGKTNNYEKGSRGLKMSEGSRKVM